MNPLTRNGAIAGMVGVCLYFVIVFAALSDQVTFLLAMLFPILSIIFLYSVKEYIKANGDSHVNQLSFLSGSFAFTILAIFLSAQLAVQIGIDASNGTESLKQLKASIRLIDMGMDVAWDMFIGTHMALFAAAAYPLTALRWWGLVSGLLGLSLMILNVLSFPYPPADSGLLDIGPFIALFWILLQARMIGLSRVVSGETIVAQT